MRAFIGVLALVVGGAILYWGFFRNKGIKQGLEELFGGGWTAMFGSGFDSEQENRRAGFFFIGTTLVIIGILLIASEAGCSCMRGPGT